MKILSEIIKIFYPSTCGFCGQKISERYTCRKCLNIIEYYQEKIVVPVREEGIYCDKIMASLHYSKIFKEKMLQYKFHDVKYMGACFAEILTLKIKKYNLNADIIIEVPISRERFRERGYNQSAIIARGVSKITGIIYGKDVLIKTKNNLRQSELSIQERKENVKDVYSIKNIELIKGKSVILIDDILTTGATLNECAKVLKENGAKEVIALAVMYANREE